MTDETILRLAGMAIVGLVGIGFLVISYFITKDKS